jgi:hypothetical protein
MFDKSSARKIILKRFKLLIDFGEALTLMEPNLFGETLTSMKLWLRLVNHISA